MQDDDPQLIRQEAAQATTAANLVAPTQAARPPLPTTQTAATAPSQAVVQTTAGVQPAYYGDVSRAEEMLKKVSAPDETLLADSMYNRRKPEVKLFGRSIGKVFAIGAILVLILIGGAALGVLQNIASNEKNAGGDSASLLASLKASTATPDNSSVQINRNTIITDNRTFTTTGDVLIQSGVNSADAFKIQNAAGQTLLVADTQNNKIGINGAPTGTAALQVTGDISTNGAIVSTQPGGFSLSPTGLSIGGVLVCTSKGCVNANPSAAQNIDTAHLAYLNVNQTFSGVNSFTNQTNFNVTSTTAFQIQNSGGTDKLFMVDTANNRVGIGTTPSASGATLQVAGDLNVSSGVYRIGNTPGASLTCGPTELLQQGVIQGGIVTGGTCVTVAGGTMPTLQQVYDASTPAHIILSNGSGMLQIQDAASPLATDLFEVTSNGGATKYFAVNNLGISVTGNVNTTGQYQVSGSQISSANLSNDANLAKLNANQTFSGNNTFSSASNSFTGSGAGLSSLNASNISSGSLSDLRLSANVTLAGNTFNGASQLVQNTAGGILPVLSGANLTNLNATNISSGTLNDFRLSANVALLNANNTFTGNNSIHLNSTAFTIQDAVSPLGADLFEITDNSGATKYFSVSATGAKVGANNVCTSAGNCVGVGGGAIGGSGTAGKLAKFTGSGFTIGDSLLSDNGTAINDSGGLNVTGTLGVNTITPTATLTVGIAAQTLSLQGDGSTSLSATAGGIKNSLVFAAPTVSNKTITIPDATGTVAVSASGPLALDAAGNLTCPTCLTSGGSGGTAGVSTLNSLTGNITLAGTPNQIIITPAGNTLTFSTPQDINTTSSPSFANVNVSGQFKVGGSQISSANLSNDADLAKLSANQSFTGTNSIQTTSATAFQVQNAAAADTMLTVDASARGVGGGNLVKIGNSTGTDTNTTILVVDSATAAPTSNLGALNGGLFYNSTTNHLNVIESGAVKELCNKTDLGCGSPVTPTLAQVYSNGANQADGTLSLDSTRQGVLIRDNSTPIGGTLFGVQDSTGGTKYLDVTASGVAVAGNVNTSGQYQVGGVQISSSNLSNDANLAKLSANQTFSGNNVFTGTTQIKNTGLSAFQIQNASGAGNLFIADTTNTRIAIAQASANYTLDVAGDINTTTGFRVGGTPGSGITCSGGQVVQNATVTGGIITGGTCIANGAGVTTTLQDAYNNSSTPATIATTSAVKGIVFKAGVGNDSTSLFQVQTSGGSAVLTIDTTNSRVGVDVTYTAMTTPSGLTINGPNAGGSLASSSTYRYKITALDSAGGETAASTEASNTTGTTNLTLMPSWSAVTGASGYKIYRTAAAGVPNSEVYLTSVLTNSFVDTGVITPGTATPPASNTAYTSTNSSNNNLQLSIGGSGTPTGQLYVSGTVPAAPLSTLNMQSNPLGVSVQGRYAYVTNAGNNSMQIVDISNPVAPRVITTKSLSGGTPSAISVQGKYAYISFNNGPPDLQILDISNINNPTSISTLDTGGSSVTLYAKGRYVYIGNSNGSMVIVDVGNPASPSIVSTIADPGPIKITVVGNYAYSANQLGSFKIFDVGNVANPVLKSTTSLSTLLDVVVSGPYAYIADNSSNLNIYDISNPSSPVVVQTLAVGTILKSIAVQGRYLYGTTGSGLLKIFDISDPYKTVLIGNVTAGTNPTGVVVQGRYAYLVNNSDDTMQIFDVGGTYTQQLEAGGAEFGSLAVDNNAKINGDTSIGGGLNVGTSLQVSGGIGGAGGLNVQGSSILAGGLNNIGPPAGAITVTPTLGAAATWSYVVTAVNSTGGETNASATGTTAAGAATLDATHFNTISWSAVTGASSYKVYRTAHGTSPSTNGFIGSSSSTSLVDNGLVGNLVNAPLADSTGQLTVLGSALFQNSTNSTTAFQIQNSSGASLFTVDTTNAKITTASDIVASNSATATVGTTSGAGGANVTTVTLASAGSFANGDVVFIDNTGGTGQDYYTRITAGGGTTTLTVSPAVSYGTAAGYTGNAAVTKYIIQDIGATSTDYTTQSNRFFQGYFLGGIVTGAGSTIYSDGNIKSITNLQISAPSITYSSTTNSPTAFQVQNAAGASLLSIDGVNNNVTIAGLDSGALSPWQTSANSLPVGERWSGAVTANGYIYNIDGSPNNNYYAKVNADGTTGAWNSISGFMPNHEAGVAYANGYIYTIGGFGTNAPSAGVTNVYYNRVNSDGTVSNARSASSLPAPRSMAATAVANGYVYQLGGADSSNNPYSSVIYAQLNRDGTIGSWQTNSNPLPVAVMGASAVVANGYVYVMGGTSSYNFGTGGQVVYYAQLNADGSTGAWSTSGNSLPSKAEVASAVVSNGYVYVLGGSTVPNVTSGLSPTNNVYFAKLNTDGTIGSWATSTNSLPTALATDPSVLVNGYIYVIGGDVGGSASSSVYYTSTSRLSVGANLDLIGPQSGDGTAGGSLIANNITVVGTLQVQGQGSFASGINVTGGVTIQAGVSDSTSIFSVQNAGGTSLLNVDTSNSNINLGQLTTGALGAWSTNANALPASRAQATSVTANGYVYVLGGSNQSTVYYAKLNADGSTGAWSTNANALPASRAQATSVTANGYVYVMGGINGTAQSTVYYAKLNADGTTGAWTTNINSLPQTLGFATSVTANGYVYVMGGINGTAQSTVYYAKLNADGSAGAWTTSASALPQTLYDATSIISNSYVYVIGGDNGSSRTSTVYYAKLNADGSTGSWQTNANPLLQTLEAATSVTINGYVYVIGGGNPSDLSTVYYAKLNSNGGTGSWFTATNALPQALSFLSGVTSNGYIYSLGGSNSGLAQSTVYYSSVQGMTRNSGQESVADQLTVGNGLTVTGNVALQPSADSTSAFSLQNATGGSLINVDSTNSVITLDGNTTGQLGQWATNANALSGARDLATSVTANGYIYEIGGFDGSDKSTVLYAKLNADGSTGAWITSANSLPQTIRNASSVVANGYAYILGGIANLQANAITYYAKLNADGSTSSWQVSPNPLPLAVYNPSATVANGYVYVMGGDSNVGISQSSVYYAKLNADGSTGAWNTTTSLPAARELASSVSANGYIYFMGGCINACGSSDKVSTIYYAKPGSDGSISSWTTSSVNLTVAEDGFSSVVNNGYVYTLGGEQSGGGLLTNVSYAKLNADGSTGTWTANTNALPVARKFATSVVSNGYVYVAGGSDGAAAQSTVYYASTARLQVGANLDLVGLQGGDGSAGGSITAGNITAVGTLQVQGQTNLSGGLGVIGNTTIQAGASNSTSTFAVQNASGTSLLTVDTSNSNIGLGQLTTGALGAWSTNANSLPAARKQATSVVANGYLYEIGGVNGAFQSTVYYAKLNADGSTGTWSTNSNALPAPLSDATSVVANGYLYELGGFTTGGVRQSSVFYAKLNADGSTGAWITSANTLLQPLAVATSVVASGYIYVMGGDNGSALNTVYYARVNPDGSIGTWSTNANVLPGARENATSITANGYVYVIGGNTNSASQSTVYYAKLNADGSTGTWTTNTNALPAILGWATSVAANGYVYEIGGVQLGGGANHSTIYYAQLNADGSTGAWNTNSSTLPTPLDDATSVVANGYVYTMGGENGSFTVQSTVYYASVQGMTRNSGQESISDQLTVGNGLTVAGNTTFQPTADSTSAFSIQNATGGSLINVDSTNSVITLDGNTSGQLGQWATNANALPQTLKAATSVTANGYIYEIGGFNGTSAQSTVYYAKLNADGSTGAWNTNTNVLPQALTSATSVVSNGYIYVIGGSGSGWLSTVYYAKLNADGSTGAWTTSTNPLPAARAQATSITSNGYVYVIGGTADGASVLSTVYYAKLNADGSTGAWQTNANALTAARVGATSVVANGYVYVMGGLNASFVNQSTVYYAKLNADGSTGGWSTNANVLPQAIFSATSVVANGYVYEMGGSNGSSDQSTVYYAKLNADGSTGGWSTNTNALPGIRDTATSVVANGYVYELGGNNGTTNQSTVYYASTARLQVGANLDLIGLQGGDGSAGGSITANNITAVGTLQVQGQASFAQGLSVGGNLTISGGVQVQGSSGNTLLGVDNVNGNVSLGQTVTGVVGTWNLSPAALPAGRACQGTVSVNGYAYAIGGSTGGSICTNGTVVSSTYYAKLNSDGSTGAWNSTTSLPAATTAGTAVTVNGYIYFIGGNNGTTDQSTVYYAKVNSDGTVGSWITSSNALPGPRSWAGSVAANGYIYLLGGVGPGGNSTVFYTKVNLDGSISAWNTGTALPAIRYNSVTVTANGYIYEIGGLDGSTPQSTVYYAKLNPDGSVGSWQTNANALVLADQMMSGSTNGSYVYIVGGNATGSGVYYAKLNTDGSTGSWTQDSSHSLPVFRKFAGAIMYNNYMYEVGGLFGSGQSTVYYTSIQGAVRSFGSSSVSDQLTVGNGLNVSGSVDLQSNFDSTSTFSVQNAAGTNLINVDSTNSVITLDGNTTGQLGAWTTSTNNITAAIYNHGSVAANGYMYIVGGDNSSAVAQSTVYYAKLNADGSTSTWTTNTNALPAARENPGVVTANGYMYVVGGYNSGVQSTVYYAKLNADGSTGAWQTNANALPAVRTNLSTVVSNGYIYAMGGWDGSSAQSTVYYAKLNADGSIGAWQTNANALTAARNLASAVVANGYVYVSGGSTLVSCGSGAQSTVYYAKLNADGSTGTWATSANALPATRCALKSAISSGYIYEIGGADGSANAYATVYYAKLNTDGSTGTWTANANALTSARAFESAIVANGYVYVAGGSDASAAAQSTVYYASTSRLQVGANLDLVGLQGGDGSAGGSITAGNITAVGTLQVQGQTNLSGGLGVIGNTTIQAGASNSTSTFAVQNASGTSLLTVDTSNSNIGLGQLTTGGLGAWSTNANTVPSARGNAASVTANGYVYVMGGCSGSPCTTQNATVYYSKLNADGSTGSWSTNASPLPVALSQAASITYNGYVYVMGGFDNSSALSTVYYAKLNADGSTGAWSTNANALPAGRNLASSVVANGYVYLMGGSDPGSPQSTVYYAKLNADGSTGAWSTNANALPQVLRFAASFTFNGYVYVIGGNGSGSSLSTVYYAKLNADGSTGTWTTNGNALPNVREQMGYATINGYAYIIGGWDGSTRQTTVYYAKLNADGSTGAWNTNANALPSALIDQGSVSSNGYIYQLTGNTAPGAVSTVYYASVQGMTRNSGQSSIADQLTVGNGLTVAGNTTFQPTADSTSAFSLQNATGGSLINVDSTNSVITLDGNTSGELGQWATNANALPATLQYASAVTANGYAYVLGGYNGSVDQSTVYYAKLNADGSTGAWSTNANALPQALQAAKSVISNGYIYEIGGRSSSTQSTVYYAKLNADGSTGAWSTNANALPGAREDETVAVANGYAYVLGGFSGSTVQSTVYYAKLNADGSTGAWQTNANALPAVRYGASTVLANGYIYVLGGESSAGTQQPTVYYAQLNSNGSIGTWSTNTNALPNATSYAASVVSNGYVYEIGGISGASFLTSVYYAKLNTDGSVGAWATNASGVTVNRARAPGLIANGYVYILGGTTSGTAISTVSYASTSRLQVGANLDLVGLQGGDGSAGGSITAGNITAVGSLQVQGAASFAQGLSVGGNLTANGSTLFQNSANSSTAFQIQNAAGNQAVNVNTSTTPNLISNGDFESTINGWSGKGSATILRNDTSAIGAAFGTGSLAVTTTAAANDGASLNYTFAPTTTYTLSLYLRSTSGTVSTINIGRQDVSGTDVDCLTGQSITTTFTRFTCTFTTGGTITSPSSIYIKQSDATARTFYIDGVQLEQASTASGFNSYQANLQVNTATNQVTLDGSNSGALGAWNTNGNAITAGRKDAATVTANGYVYVLGGSNASGTDQSTVYYAKLNADGSTGAWTTSANPLTQTLSYPGSITANGYVYIFGGINVGTPQSTVYYAKLNADGSTSAWTTSSNPLLNARFGASSITANGYVYVMGGMQIAGGTPQNTVYYAKLNANGSTGTWSSGTVLTQALALSASVTANGYVYMMGGCNASACGTNQSTVYYAKLNADGSIGSWTTSSNPLLQALSLATSVTSNGYVYVMGGFTSARISTVYYAKLNADGSTGAWSTNVNALPQTLSDVASITANGYIYEIGGTTGGAVANSTVYYASTSRIQLGGNLDLVGLQGGTLSDPGDQSSGSVGGSITAGNITAIGSFQVQGAASFAQGVGIAGDLTVNAGLAASGGAMILTGNANSSLTTTAGTLSLQGFGTTTISTANKAGANTSDINITTGNVTSGGSASGSISIDVGTSTGTKGTISIGNGNASAVVLGSLAGSAQTVIQGGTGNIILSPSGSSSSGVLVKPGTDSTAAFQVQNAGGTVNLMTIDTSGSVITFSGTTTTFASIVFNNAHVKSMQTTAPTIGTPTNCGTGSPAAAVTAASTDSAGSFTITTGTTATTCDTVFSFNTTYGAAPKSVLVTAKSDSGSAQRQIYVSATSATTFTVKFGASANPADTTTYSFYYWVIE